MRSKEEIEKQLEYTHSLVEQLHDSSRGRASISNTTVNEIYTQQELFELEFLKGKISSLLWAIT
jgi:hypothetical protein